MDVKVGTLIKNIRKERNLTLQELSTLSGLSLSYISMLERNINSPTVASLQSICLAFKMTLADLLGGLDSDNKLIKKSERVVVFSDPLGVTYEALTDGNRNIKSICMTVKDDSTHTSERHISDEFGYLLEGSMIMTVENIPYELHSGDSLYIPVGSAHKFYKTSKEDCVSLWVYHNANTEPTHLRYKHFHNE